MKDAWAAIKMMFGFDPPESYGLLPYGSQPPSMTAEQLYDLRKQAERVKIWETVFRILRWVVITIGVYALVKILLKLKS